jgi:hypothetical protein
MRPPSAARKGKGSVEWKVLINGRSYDEGYVVMFLQDG